MNRDASSLRDISNHGIAWHGLTALGIAHHQSVNTLDLDTPSQPDSVDDAAEDGRLGLLHLIRWNLGVERPDHLSDRHIPASHRNLKTPSIGQGEDVGRAIQTVIIGGFEPAPPHLTSQNFLAQSKADGLL